MTKYFYKEGTYTRKGINSSWDYNSWIQTGLEIEVSKEFYYSHLLPDEKRIVEGLKSKGIDRCFHHSPFIKKS